MKKSTKKVRTKLQQKNLQRRNRQRSGGTTEGIYADQQPPSPEQVVSSIYHIPGHLRN